MSKILLLGGTGFIGSYVLKKLLEAGHQVRILSRKQRNSQLPNVEYVQGHLLDKSSLVLAVKDVDIIIQSVQFPGHPVERSWLGEDHTYEGLDGQGTVNVVEAIQQAGSQDKLKQYIYISGAGVSLGLDYPWTRAKQRAEEAIQSLKVGYTILRPSWVYGKGDQSMSKFVLFAKYLPFFPVIGDGTAPVNPVLVDDLAQIIFNSIANPLAINKIIEVGSLPELSMKEVAQILLKEVGVKKPIICHPKPLMKLAGLFAQFIPISPLSPNSVEFLTMDVHMSDLQAKILGVKLQSLSEGLKQSGLL